MSDKIRIGIAEDHQIFIDALSTLLNMQANMEIVLIANDGQELLDKLQTTEIDVLLLDLDMPVMTGSEALRIIRRKYQQQIKVIILSTHDESMYIRRLMQSGANSYLIKSCDFEIMKEAIESVHETGNYFYDEVTPELLLELREGEKTYETMKGEALSNTEIKIVQMLCKQMSCQDIAKELNRSPRTIENHRYHIMKKIDANNAMGMMEYAIIHEIHKVEI